MTLKEFKEITKDMPEDADMLMDIGFMSQFFDDILEVFYDKEKNQIKILEAHYNDYRKESQRN